MRSHILSLLMYGITLTSGAQIYRPYLFQAKGGTEGWRKIQSHDEMIRRCQMPNDSLTHISTDRLIETCLSYPMLLDFLAHDNIKVGFEKTMNSFNGFTELIQRKDVKDRLTRFFLNLRMEAVDTIKSTIGKGDFTFKVTALELMITHDSIMNSIDSDNRILLIHDIVKKYQIMPQHFLHYGNFGKFSMAYLLVKIMSRHNLLDKQDDSIRLFMEKMIVTDPKVIDGVFSTAQGFAKK